MSRRLTPGICWKLGDTDSEAIPPLLFDLLKAVERHGSLAAAARQCGVSYRNAWNLMKDWREALGASLIESTQGRGASLTECGSKLLWARDHAEVESASLLQSLAQRVRIELDPIMRGPSTEPMVIHASHCLSHQPLRQLLHDEHRVQVTFRHGGSARCLQHLAAGDCIVAGFHLAEGPLASGFIEYYRRFFSPAECRLVHAVRRRQGLIVKRGNPLGIQGISDLSRADVRFVNRQANSGTRMLLDLLLASADIDAEDIHGYDNIEFTHSAVSAMVAGGSADAGLGLEAAAVAQDQDFIPLAGEIYYYAVRDADWRHPTVRALRQALAGERWRSIVAEMDGFDASGAGTETAATDLF